MRTACLALILVTLGASPCLAACGGHATPPPTPAASTATTSGSPLPTASSDQTFNVRDFGARGDGTSDDTAALRRALVHAARVGGAVYLPTGTYFCATTVKLPDGVRVGGDGQSSWLQGRLIFGSHDVVSRLKIGRLGQCAVTNSAGATDTTFVDCRLHGGGSTSDENSSVLYLGGLEGNVSGITFLRCRIERTSYVPPAGVNAYRNGVGNTITIHEFCYLPHSGHVEHIAFRDCYLGASNGHASGALRMVMEAFTWDNRTGRVYHGWKDLVFQGCTVAAGDTTGLDFADNQLPSGAHSASEVLIDGCTFLGAAADRSSGFGGLPIVYECPTGIVITHNTFYAAPHEAIGGSHVGQGTTAAPGLLIQGNTFDMTRSPVGLTHETGSACIKLVGYKSRIQGNTFVYRAGLGVVIEADKAPAVGNTVAGNTFTDLRASGGEPTVELTSQQGQSCSQNHITGNTITNRAAGGAGVIAQIGGGPNFATGNVIDAGTATPFVGPPGKLVHAGNQVT